MAEKRRRFTVGCKDSVALEALPELASVLAIVVRHEFHPTQVGVWKRQAAMPCRRCSPRTTGGGSPGGPT